MMVDFTTLPVRWIDLRYLRWGDNGLNKDHMADPFTRRDIDDEPVWAEQLISGQHFFIHDGRHRCIRSIARGEYEIQAYALTHSLRKDLLLASTA